MSTSEPTTTTLPDSPATVGNTYIPREQELFEFAISRYHQHLRLSSQLPADHTAAAEILAWSPTDILAWSPAKLDAELKNFEVFCVQRSADAAGHGPLAVWNTGNEQTFAHAVSAVCDPENRHVASVSFMLAVWCRCVIVPDLAEAYEKEKQEREAKAGDK